MTATLKSPNPDAPVETVNLRAPKRLPFTEIPPPPARAASSFWDRVAALEAALDEDEREFREALSSLGST